MSISHVLKNLTFLNELWSYCITSSSNYADHKNLIKKSSCITCPKELSSTQRMQILHPIVFPSLASISQEKHCSCPYSGTMLPGVELAEVSLCLNTLVEN